MCSGPEQSKSTPSSSPIAADQISNPKNTHQMTADDTISSFLELAANNDHEAFNQLIEVDDSAIDGVDLWYCRKKGSRQLVHEPRTPLMVAATYGSIDVLKLILSHPKINVNNSCGSDETTALHCAASGGSVNAADVVKLLLSAGADSNLVDSNGFRPADVIVSPPKLVGVRAFLEELLMKNVSYGPVSHHNLRVSIHNSNSTSPTLSSSPGEGSPCSPSDLISSPMANKFNDLPANPLSEKKEYPFDSTLPDIKNGVYTSDEFRMFSFKIKPCSRAYSHDWTDCPFVHPGENARRRDPRKYHYSCVPCPEFRKGTCMKGDLCEYAHGVFECWLHPAQYRTRLCKDGTCCERRVCFFAHKPEELRPLYASTGSGIPSPRSNSLSTIDMAAALNLLPGSPSSMMLPSPSANGVPHSSMAWPQSSVPTLSLPGSNLQSSRLRSSLNARDIPLGDLSLLSDFDGQQQVLNDLSCFSQNRSNFATLSRSCLSKSLTPSNLDELFSAEFGSSPRYSNQGSGAFSPSHRSSVLNHNQFQQQQNMLSPIHTNLFSPKKAEHPLLQNPFGAVSPRCMSPRKVEPISPMSTRLSAFAQHETLQQQHRSLSSRDLGSKIKAPIVGSPVGSWSNWGSPNGKVDWSVKNSEIGCLKKSSSFELNNSGDEPDLSWVQSLVKESPPQLKDKKLSGPVSGIISSGEVIDDEVLGSWIEQMQLDQIIA